MNSLKSSKLANNCRFESSTTEDDFQKLMDICNSYGLNEQETNQLIDEFKKGALFSPNHSFNDSLNESVADIPYMGQKHQEEEYSFKHQKQSYQEEAVHHQEEESKQCVSNTDRNSNRNCNQFKEDQNAMFEHLEKILTEKFAIEKGLVKNLQDENIRLKSQMQEKERQISRLTEMKGQETEIIIGLKDIIANLTLTLKEKETSFKDVHEKYNNLMETRVRELSSKRSLTQFSEQELQDVTNGYQHSMRDSSCHKKSAKNLKESREQYKQNRQDFGGYDKKRGNRIDVKKYKEMIENLRNNC